LTSLIDEAARCWGLTPAAPVPDLSYNYVAPARRADGTDVVLKIGVPNPELTSEINALRLYDGRGAVRLLESDRALGMCLLERLRPGEMLTTLDDDDLRTRIAADVMLCLWRPAPEGQAFLRLSDWFNELKNLHPRFGGTTGPLPR